MPTSALVITVPAAEALVEDLRNRFDATSKLGVPAHFTVLFPFMPPDEIALEVLRLAQAALNAVPAFDFSLTGVGRFPTTAYLIQHPPEPFIALTTALMESFPTYRPYGGAHESNVSQTVYAYVGGADLGDVAESIELQLRLFVDAEQWTGQRVMAGAPECSAPPDAAT